MVEKIEIVVSGFGPLQLTIPKFDKFVGEVAIILPDVHVQLYDLLKGVHIGGDGPAFSVIVTVPEPGINPAQVMGFLYEAQDILKDMWEIAQAELDKRGALLGDRNGRRNLR